MGVCERWVLCECYLFCQLCQYVDGVYYQVVEVGWFVEEGFDG